MTVTPPADAASADCSAEATRPEETAEEKAASMASTAPVPTFRPTCGGGGGVRGHPAAAQAAGRMLSLAAGARAAG